MNPNDALKLFHKIQNNYILESNNNWKPKIGDYIKITDDIKTRFGLAKKGYIGQIEKLHGKTKIGICVFKLHKAIIVDICDIEPYEPKKYRKII